MDYHTREKLYRSAKSLDGIATCLMLLGMVGAAMLALALLIPYFREELYANITQRIDFGDIRYGFYDSSLMPAKEILNTKFLRDISLVFVIFIYCFAIGFILRKMMKPIINEEKYFSAEFSKGFKTLIILVAIACVIAFANDMINEYFFKAYEMTKFASVYVEPNNAFSGTRIHAQYQGSYISIGALGGGFLLLLSILFKHGEKLQVQSDETL